MYNRTLAGVKELARMELEMAQKDHGNRFNSPHEAYAIIFEEEEELWDEYVVLDRELESMWKDCVRKDLPIGEHLKEIEKRALKCACEAIQVAAMARKAM